MLRQSELDKAEQRGRDGVTGSMHDRVTKLEAGAQLAAGAQGFVARSLPVLSFGGAMVALVVTVGRFVWDVMGP